MSDTNAPATLNELVGKDTDMSLANLPQILGEKMPELEMSESGRIRLVNALAQRFGPQFQSIPGVSKILDEFDKEMNADLVLKKGRM